MDVKMKRYSLFTATIVVLIAVHVAYSRRSGRITREYLDDILESTRTEELEIYNRNVNYLSQGLDTKSGRLTAIQQFRANGYNEFIEDECRRGYVSFEFTRRVAEAYGVSCNDLASSNIFKAFANMRFESCEEPTLDCSGQENAYRTPDGSCNNLMNPTWGQTGLPQKRLLPPDYGDRVNSPRMSQRRRPLPNVRELSNEFFRDPEGPEDKFDLDSSYWEMQFGQVLDHDLIRTPVVTGANGSAIDCCATQAMDPRPESCFVIDVPDDDEYFVPLGINCINFVRSAPADVCPPAKRSQINVVSSYIDASMVYGSTADEQLPLRTQSGGLLKTSPGIPPLNKPLLPPTDVDRCMDEPEFPDTFCVAAGDTRPNVNPTMSAFHTVLLREHNRCAGELSASHPEWDDERLYQECRKIMAALIQHITYAEYLPVVLGEEIMEKFGLNENGNPFDDVYDDSVDATISTSFGVAPFRFAHSNIIQAQNRIFQNLSLEMEFDLAHVFNKPSVHQTGEGVEGLSRWMSVAKGALHDRFFTNSVRDKLFKDSQNRSQDLPAVNVQRGRDHGVPGYNHWRKRAGLSVFNRRHIERKESARADHSLDVARKIAEIYDSDEDIDLYVGGISEILLPGANVGPLFAIMIAEEFRRLKIGDRYYFENPNPNPKVGFTAEQLQSIKNYTFAKMICVNNMIPTIQPEVLKMRNEVDNQPVLCSSLPDIDFDLF